AIAIAALEPRPLDGGKFVSNVTLIGWGISYLLMKRVTTNLICSGASSRNPSYTSLLIKERSFSFNDVIVAVTTPDIKGIAIAGCPTVTACSPIKITFPFASPYPVCVILQSPLALSQFFHF